MAKITEMKSADSGRKYKYLEWITIIYIAFQLISDVTAGKIMDLFGYSVSVTVLYFPVTYIFGDVLTEVYGYAKARSVLWKVMVCSVVAGLIYQIVIYLPPATGYDPAANDAYTRVLGSVPRILLGGWLAVFAGEIVNNYVMARMKIVTNGGHLWARTIGSTLVGQFINTTVFYIVALYGILPNYILFESIIVGWLAKTAVEVMATPATYAIVKFLKKEEGEDYYDNDTDFNPFLID